jgi:catechol 2,3-dioxygenase-like lactoylglutathione lyase family enzyme
VPENKHSSAISIQLTVASLEGTEAFYAGILELPLMRALTVARVSGHLIMEREGWRLIFVEEDAVIRNHPILEERFLENEKGVGMTLHFTVENIEEIFDAVIDEELEIVYPLRTHPYGVKEFWCRDPDGYLVVLEEAVRSEEHQP